MLEMLGHAGEQKILKGLIVKEPASVPVAVSSPMACVQGNDLYMAGGSTGSNTVNTFRKFNLLNRTWTNLANLPKALEGAVLAPVGNFIYLFGGGVFVNSAVTYNATIYKYDIVNNVWTTLSNAPAGGRRLFSGGAIDKKLYYFGGWNGAQLNRVECFDTVTETWSTLPNLPANRHGHAAVSDGSKIYMFAGLTNGGTVNNDVFVFDPFVSLTVSTLATGATKPPARCYPAICIEENVLYIYSGYSDGNGAGVRTDFWMLPLGSKEWKQLPLTGYAAVGRGGPAYTYWKEELHILAGFNPTSGRMSEHIYIK